MLPDFDPETAARLNREERLWRRVPADRMKFDGARLVPQSSTFRARSDEDTVSVDRALIHEQGGRGPGSLLVGDLFTPYWGVIETTVAACEDIAATAVYADPLDENEAHAVLYPAPSKKASRNLILGAAWIWASEPQWPQPGRTEP